MQETNDIDFILTLHPHGWSTCWIVIHGDKYELIISHVFGDPYIDFMEALTKLIKGNNNSTFYWYREPGGEKFEIKRLSDRRDKVCVSITGFNESYGSEIKDYKKTVEFEIKLENLLIVAYFQLKKIFLLLKDKDYAKDRQKDFPFEDFIKFEQIVKEFLVLD